MRPPLILATGMIVFGVTLAGWYWLNALACGMADAACRQFRVRWDDWEALSYFIPTFTLGAVLMMWGLWRILRKR
jgi:hypothetical protein